jgi:hypothetical protein
MEIFLQRGLDRQVGDLPAGRDHPPGPCHHNWILLRKSAAADKAVCRHKCLQSNPQGAFFDISIITEIPIDGIFSFQ